MPTKHLVIRILARLRRSRCSCSRSWRCLRYSCCGSSAATIEGRKRMAMVGSNPKRSRWLGLYLPLTGFMIFLLFPFYWMLIVSLKPNNELLDTEKNPFFLASMTLDHYTYLFTDTSF